MSADNKAMGNYLEALKTAIKEKTEWFNFSELPKLLDTYRLLHTCVKNIYNILIQRSLLTPDPYKLEKKISDIVAPEDTPYSDADRSVIIGARFSEYESMLDYVCTYVKFSVENMNIQKIKKLHDLNMSFLWGNMNSNNTKSNTRGLASLLLDARKNVPQITLSMINDSIAKSAQSVSEIEAMLKSLSDFYRETYKLRIRMDIQQHPSYNKMVDTPAEETAEIKKLFPSIMGKEPYYGDLISEIIDEDLASNKAQLQAAVLKRLEIPAKAEEPKQTEVNTRFLLLDSVHSLVTLGAVYNEIVQKLTANVKILEEGHNSIFDKLKRAFRKAFNLKEPALIYNFVIVDLKKETKTQRPIDINVFISNLARKSGFYSVLENRSSGEFRKISEAAEANIFAFVNKQISENNETLILLNAADDYFKAHAPAKTRNSIKGLKIDLIAVKNALVKANSRRAEYTSYIEETEQLRKIGITNAG